MALKDPKSITVAPGQEDSAINLWQSFGWEMKSTQEVKTSDSSHLERRGDTIYNVTKAGEHYIKITFERDQSRPNYKELVSLESQYLSLNSQYHNVPGPGSEPGRIGWGGCLYFIILIILAFSLISGAAAALEAKANSIISLVLGILGLIFFVLSFVIIIRRIRSYSSRHEPWEEAKEAFENERKEILNKRDKVLKQARDIINQS